MTSTRHRPFFTRVRPFVDIETIHDLLREIPLEINAPAPGEFHFTSGRGALKWLLQNLRLQQRRSLRVGLQAFTCVSVLKAIQESGNQTIPFDIRPQDFSTGFSDIQFESIDVLILTHLFGIPNHDYLTIAKECKRRKIILIDDISQTAGAYVQGVEVGTLGDFSIKSYGFDKPLSTFRGGTLTVRGNAVEFRQEFSELPIESIRAQKSDLIRLFELHRRTDPDIYDPQVSAPAPLRWVNRALAKGSELLSIEMKRMGVLKTFYLNRVQSQQATLAVERHENAKAAQAFLKMSPVVVLDIPTPRDLHVVPVRMAVLVEAEKRTEFVDWLASKGIEAGAHNWPYVAPYRVNPSEERNFPNSEFVSRSIVNVPLWTEKIWV